MAFLEIDGVTKRFGGLVALNSISFSVAKGEIVGIIGPNGAGKTTLFGVISGFVPPNEGDVRFEGTGIIGVSPDRLVRRGLVRSFQIVQTFADMTTLDVVTAAALTRRPIREAVDYAALVLERVGLAGKESQTPATLSLQDKKLLELAKCVATDPRCILLDEVMAGLTLTEAEAPIAIIHELNNQGVTIVMVEHVMPVIMRLATRIVVINFGEKIAEATPEEIVRDQRVIDAYFGNTSMLEIEDLVAGYGGVAVLRDVSVKLAAGELVGLLGANNAGKTTLINALSGMVSPMSGRILFEGDDITRLTPRQRVELGIVQVPEGRLVFPEMSVRENLQLGGINARAKPNRGRQMDAVLDLFPRLKERLSQDAGTLSGGEQQMLAIGRGLMADAKLLMLDEPSLGLSPLFVKYIFDIVDRLHAEGLTILLIEQNLMLTLRHAERCYVLERGQVAIEGPSDVIKDDPRTRSAYLGL